MTLEKVASNKAFGGELIKYKFKSAALGGLDAHFNVFLPPISSIDAPLLVYLAGLTCTEDHGPQKGGFLQTASKEGIAMLFPDTSPRGAGIEGEDTDWDFGTGAGFYINATHPQWSKHYNMLTHITLELPQVLSTAKLPIDFKRQSICGHSMGGHGALTLYLGSKTNQYRSASAFAPIMHPTACPWGEKAFKGYLQGGLEEGKAYDATLLIATRTAPANILIDWGTADNFYKQGQLLPENFAAAVDSAGLQEKIQLRSQDGYDHSYFFISSFSAEHVEFHARHLKA